jgi:polysaccharide biosynthesis protein PelE
VSARSSALGVVVCGALDGALAVRLLTHPPAAAGLAALFVVHVALALLAGLALRGVVPPFARVTRREIVGCSALIAACIPVFGGVGMLLALRFGLTEPRGLADEAWVAFDVEGGMTQRQRHPLRARRAAVSAPVVRAALERRSEETATRRFEAVLAVQRLPPRVGVPLLKLAQSDPSDEIRLYAFSRLERMRDDLEKQVKDISRSLETAEGTESARLHLRLAQSYWELGYLGLAEGAVLAHAMTTARRHATIATEQCPGHAPAEFFLGRILLQMREHEAASLAFTRAIAAGYPRVKVLPWLAECAFYERDFATVTALLAELDSLSPENVFFQPVSDLWARRDRGEAPPPRGSRESLRIGSERSLQRAST